MYDYDIVTGAELHRHPELLQSYRAVMLNTHCEYWSKEMFAGLRAFHEERGGWILNVGGNSIYREIEFFEDGSTRCASLSFVKSCADESRLLGVRFCVDNYGTCAPYRVLTPDHWIFAGSGLTEGASFGLKSLNGHGRPDPERYDPGQPGLQGGLRGEGASGWEMDQLTETAPSDFCVVARGMNKAGGADMVIREPAGSRGG